MKKENWKEILDPCFDEMVKSYSLMIDEVVDIFKKGDFQLPEKLKEFISSNTDLNSPYEIDESKSIEILKLLIPELSKTLSNAQESQTDEFMSDGNELLNLVNYIPEKSRQFYINELKSDYDNYQLILSRNLPKKEEEELLTEFRKQSTATVSSLFLRFFFQQSEKLFERKFKSKNKVFENQFMCYLMVSNLINYHSQIVYKKTLSNLLSKGDDISLLKAVRLDKTLIFSEAVKKRIIRAQMEGDFEFNKKLSNKIKLGVPQKESENFKIYLILKQFWLAGLYKLTQENIYDFLCYDCDIELHEDLDTFKKFFQRDIKDLLK